MLRREFIAGLGSAAAWPLAALAQQRDRLGRVGILFGGSENNPEQILVGRVHAGIGTIGLGRGPQCADRSTLDQ